MSSLAHPLQWLPLAVIRVWECSILAQCIVLILLLRNKNLNKLPRFTIYIFLNLCQACFLWFFYSMRIDWETLQTVAWTTEAITLIAQAFATAEVLGITLRPYRGIWGLSWRALILVSTMVLVVVALGERGAEPAARIFELNRGYHLVFASAVIACLLFIRYYSIPVAPAYKMILAGFCFFSCTQVLVNTVIEMLFQKHFKKLGPIWEFATVFSFLSVLAVWAIALRRALPAETPQPRVTPGSGYRELSPQINEQLQLLNEKLGRFWKAEAPPR